MTLRTAAIGGAFAVSCVGLVYVWDRFVQKRSPSWPVVTLFVAVTGAALVWIAAKGNFDADEVEHLHIAWLMGQDVLPYRDVLQNHMPMAWLLAAPLVSVLPESTVPLLALRGLCLASFALSLLAGMTMLRDLSAGTRETRLGLALLMLAVATQFEFYCFRPDPFMSMFTSWGIVAVLRLPQQPLRYAALAGVAFGLAASFSPKMAPLALLVPSLFLLGRVRHERPQPIMATTVHGLCFAAALVPVVVWLHGQGLWGDFWADVAVFNANVWSAPAEPPRLASFVPPALVVLAMTGAWTLFRAECEHRAAARYEAVALSSACILGYTVQLLGLNHESYNLQAMAVPAAVLGAIGLTRVRTWGQGWPKSIVFALALALICFRPAWWELHRGVANKGAPQPVLESLMDLSRESGGTCLGFTPFHPVFCRDATELYLAWQARIIWHGSEAELNWIRPTVVRAMTELEANPPGIIVGNIWQVSQQRGLVDQATFERLTRERDRDYERPRMSAVWVLRTGDPSSR